MASNRATKSGFAADAQARINSKYDSSLAKESLEWIASKTGANIETVGDMDNLYEVLKDGKLLCELTNSLKPGSVKKINTSAMAFKCMENINAFLAAVAALGVPSHESFQTVDLWEKQNLTSVVICLQSLKRHTS